MDTSRKTTSKDRGLGRRGPFLFTLAAAQACLPLSAELVFAEELFPELQQLMQSAALEAPEIQLRELLVEEREGDLVVAKSNRRPSARLNARVLGSYEIREDIDNTFRGNLNANLVVTQPLYHWGALARAQSIAESRIDLEAGEAARVGAQQFMQLRRAYLQWLLMRERQDILGQSITVSESFVAARRRLVDVGQASEQEVLEMEARLLENRESLAWVESRIRDLENQLARLVGPALRLDELDSRPLTIIEPMSPAEWEDFYRSVTGRPSDLASPYGNFYSTLGAIEEETLLILDKNNWPKFDLVAGSFSDRLEAVNQDNSVFRVQFYAGLQVNWNIFDGWRTEGQKISALARKRGFELRSEAAREETVQRSKTLLAELQLNLKQIEARSKREVILERRVALLRQQAERAQITGIDLIEGEIDYLEVRQRLAEARVNYLMNLMEMGILLGQDPAAVYYERQS